ncbi:MAG: radical SAM protein [Defluviitaleaceae bacterium]|nr:radical SAM protein [Defluviitaleaceae bacterium]
MRVQIANIQRYAIHDGGGIRTTIFFQGCPLSCNWCHNPETMGAIFSDKGLTYSPQELAKRVLRDQVFFGDNGGVTISGGEPLAQDMGFIVKFLQLLKEKGIHIACDTCGDVPWENVEAVLPYVDIFLYDLKIATPELHKKHTGQDNTRIISNLKKLSNVWLRIPVIGGVNDGEEMNNIIALAKSAAPTSKVSLLPYHNMAEGKWEKLGKKMSTFYTPANMEEIKNKWIKAGFNAEIGG